LLGSGFTQGHLGAVSGLIVEELRRWLLDEQSARGESLFRRGVQDGRIQFRLRLDANLNWSMPFTTQTSEPEGARQVFRNDGPLQKSLFTPIYDAEFNSDERDVAVYLDGDSALTWWHRNVARSQYALQGWRREKIYPDFIFAVEKDGGAQRIAVLETKGDHLAGNVETEYKRAVLKLVTDEFSLDTATPAGTLALSTNGIDEVRCEMVLMSEWQRKLPTLLRT
jgi:type III restriction enzyme